MLKLIACALNFSQGKDKSVIEKIVAAAQDVRVLDVASDPDHNRTVLTFLGEPGAVGRAALAISAKAVELIDLRRHRGGHPRMGAVDVIPFVPIRGVSMEECVSLAQEVGRRIGAEMAVPVYLYEAAATVPQRRDLAQVRRGEFEGLAQKMQDPAWRPDYGPALPHPTAGAVAVGARPYLVAFNVNLGTDRVETAKEIARSIRERDGGLPHVKALGIKLAERDLVQVSINLVDPYSTPLWQVFEAVKVQAARLGVSVVSSEIVGLVPLGVLAESARHYLQLEGFQPDQILETHLLEE